MTNLGKVELLKVEESEPSWVPLFNGKHPTNYLLVYYYTHGPLLTLLVTRGEIISDWNYSSLAKYHWNLQSLQYR